METIKIGFKGFIEVDKEDVRLFATDGDSILYDVINKLSTQQILDGLQDGVYMLDFISCYVNALNGEEEYEFSLSVE